MLAVSFYSFLIESCCVLILASHSLFISPHLPRDNSIFILTKYLAVLKNICTKLGSRKYDKFGSYCKRIVVMGSWAPVLCSLAIPLVQRNVHYVP
jgi:hypothetical protein